MVIGMEGALGAKGWRVLANGYDDGDNCDHGDGNEGGTYICGQSRAVVLSQGRLARKLH